MATDSLRQKKTKKSLFRVEEGAGLGCAKEAVGPGWPAALYPWGGQGLGARVPHLSNDYLTCDIETA